jgi:predicted transcriptional regulator of viral defense system
MKKKCFDWESVFAFVWNGADEDGLWTVDAAAVARKFGVSEEEVHDMLSDLCDRGLIQRVGTRDFIIMKWPETDRPDAEELRWWEFTATLRHR